ncbi:hypothetical protein TPAU25S_03463 [Tsukamurella paurometabola]|uniref:DUF732 domain-containing protein n=1 Tax=Tsukamurella paurometabola (strain ATCC 8368 / DSM 20162 / CCUG 35730 / CIP 100753 / JCM 10117 / KCTC 9821 / NBRC 16120 / NCIMB 702349 / NCTC 13040) TaxID=521096 RepID=D5UQJ0_TSUPD|nr:DUF732 domain-containing protein [Tsukamurella paurometabola]ADG76823.1 hypothetical protein Tpau_0169 [Tsukamurella paurometabola DSM 20162]SUP41788.1 Uncharacterised protein [Tsukamurella paurometabola]
MAGLRGALAVAVMTGGVLLGAVACGGSSTVSAPTTAVDGGGPTSLPATAPESSASVPSGYPGPPSVASSPKDKEFVAKMRSEGLVASDETIIGAAQYTCDALSQSPNPRYVETLVKGMLGPSRTGDGVSADKADKLATDDANKLIAEAKSSYCKK